MIVKEFPVWVYESEGIPSMSKGIPRMVHGIIERESPVLVLRTDDTNKKINAWIDIYFLTYFHCKLYK
jgi:hypothetical protein